MKVSWKTGRILRVECVSILEAIGCDILEEKDMGGIRHGTSVWRSCIRYVSKMEGCQAIRCVEARSIFRRRLRCKNVFHNWVKRTIPVVI